MKKLLLTFPLFALVLAGQSININRVEASRIVHGHGTPSSNLCSVSGDAGKVYIRDDAAGAHASFYKCANTSPGVYAWELEANGATTIPSTTSALKGDGSGNAAAVTGNATDCVLVNGTSAACGGVSSGAALPGTCTDGQVYSLTGSNAGIYDCVDATWVPSSQPPSATGDGETDYYPSGSTTSYIGIKAPSSTITASGGIVRYQLPTTAPVASTFQCGIPDAVTFISTCVLVTPEISNSATQVSVVDPFFQGPRLTWSSTSGALTTNIAPSSSTGMYTRVSTKSTTPTSGDKAQYAPFGLATTPIYSIGNAGTWTSWHTSAQVRVDDTGTGAMADISFWFGPSRSTADFAIANSVQILADTSGAITCTTGGGAYTTTNFVYYTNAGGTTTCADSGVAVQAATTYLLDIHSEVKGQVTFSVTPGGNITTISTNVPTALDYINSIGCITRTAAQKAFGIAKYSWFQNGLPTN